MKLLVVDDDQAVARIVARYLEQDGHTVDLAANGQAALDLLCKRRFDLIVLDVLLPDTTGLAVCQALRASAGSAADAARWQTEARIPVLMLSALGLTDDIVDGLRSGADDYLSKPFEPRELVERVRTLLRRLPQASPEHQTHRYGDLLLDEQAGAIACGDSLLDLPRREYTLLVWLLKHPARLFCRDELLTAVWGWDFTGADRAVDLCILRLRQKLKSAGCRDVIIETVRGGGYRLQVRQSEARR
jgi:DNA-binding response OmpR family regulator